MRFRILSDLHLDVNSDLPFSLQGDTSVFTLIAGDIAGIPKIREKWLNLQCQAGYKGIFVEGNHVVYKKESLSLDEVYLDLQDKFPKDKDSLSFFENDYMILTENDERVLIIGCTFWTDFNLDNNPGISGYYAERGMNDFHFKAIKSLPEEEYDGKAANRWNDGIRHMRWEDLVAFNKQSLQFIKDTMKNLDGQYDKVVIVTHHGPSAQSLDKQYVGSSLNAAYVSRQENFILDNPKIKLWVHGHVHQNFDYMIGECRVVCNPRGYVMYSEAKRFNPDLIVEI